jgi:hypothetical protein
MSADGVFGDLVGEPDGRVSSPHERHQLAQACDPSTQAQVEVRLGKVLLVRTVSTTPEGTTKQHCVRPHTTAMASRYHDLQTVLHAEVARTDHFRKAAQRYNLEAEGQHDVSYRCRTVPAHLSKSLAYSENSRPTMLANVCSSKAHSPKAALISFHSSASDLDCPIRNWLMVPNAPS